MENLPEVLQPLAETTDVRNRIVVSVAGEDEFINYSDFGLNFDSSEEAVLNAIRPFIQEKYSVDIRDRNGHWLYKTRKAVSNQNIHVIPNSTAGMQTQSSTTTPTSRGSGVEHKLSYLDDVERLKAYERITKGCMHLWSKNKLQEDRLVEVLTNFAELAEKDPLFLAHFTSYVFKNLDSKDLKVVSAFMNSLSDADGTPFFQGAEYKKPNLRIISQAALCELDPKLVLRVVKLANSKRKIGSKSAGTHFSRHLKTALTKYLRFREGNPKMLEGVRKAGLGNTMKSLYRVARIAPSVEAVKILRWKQKSGPGASVKIEKDSTFNFTGLSDLAIAEKIRTQRLKPMPTLGALPDKISPVVAAAILEQCSGDQAVVLTSMFEDQGLLKHAEVRKVYDEKIRTAKQALDRVERVKKDLDETTREILREARSAVRKEQVGDVGKIFLHIDISGSMTDAIEIAKNRGSIIAECVKNPQQNFFWGAFNTNGYILQNPEKFTKDAFMARLYGVRPGGGTNCVAMFDAARKLGCDTDVYITDGQHTTGDVASLLRNYQRSGGTFPRQAVIIKCGTYTNTLEEGLKAVGIPTSTIAERQLTESALVTQAIRGAILGAGKVLEDVMSTELLSLPKWWEVVK
jgi:hypothetical protein